MLDLLRNCFSSRNAVHYKYESKSLNIAIVRKDLIHNSASYSAAVHSLILFPSLIADTLSSKYTQRQIFETLTRLICMIWAGNSLLSYSPLGQYLCWFSFFCRKESNTSFTASQCRDEFFNRAKLASSEAQLWYEIKKDGSYHFTLYFVDIRKFTDWRIFTFDDTKRISAWEPCL